MVIALLVVALVAWKFFSEFHPSDISSSTAETPANPWQSR
jgi:hypothetical protein